MCHKIQTHYLDSDGANQSLLLLFNAVCLAEKRYSLIAIGFQANNLTRKAVPSKMNYCKFTTQCESKITGDKCEVT